jgi:Na+(H+)/acetate symporter ActP
MIFKADDRAAVERSAEYQSLDKEYSRALETRRIAALHYSALHGVGSEEKDRLLQDSMRGSTKGDAPPPSVLRQIVGDENSARQRYVAANKELGDIRKRAGDLVQSATGKAFNDTNYVFPTFITTFAPVGVVGLIIAAIFAAAMSASSGELNSLATATVMDIYRRHIRREASDAHYLKVAKLTTGFWGLFACVVALFAARQGSLIEVVNKFGSFFYGSMLGVFALAIGTKRATGRGAFWGMLCGLASVALVSNLTSISYLWYNLVGCVVVVVTGMLLSLTDRPPQPSKLMEAR